MTARTPPPAHVAAEADLAALGARFAEAVLAARSSPGEPTALVDGARLLEIARWLRDDAGYGFLRSVTAVDHLPASPRFHVVYHLTALPAHVLAGEPTPGADAPSRLLRLKVAVPADDPEVPSLTGLYPTADWHERETFDMFGIRFAGHPDLRRILMPAGTIGHPLRKDFPLGYEEVAFSDNRAEIARRKPRAGA